MGSANMPGSYGGLQNTGGSLFRYVFKRCETICNRAGTAKWICFVKSRRPALIKTGRKQTQTMAQKMSRRSLLPLLLAALIAAGISGEIILSGAEAAGSDSGHEISCDDADASELDAPPVYMDDEIIYRGEPNLTIDNFLGYSNIRNTDENTYIWISAEATPAGLPQSGNVAIFSRFNYVFMLFIFFLISVIGFECLGRFISLYSLKHHK